MKGKLSIGRYSNTDEMFIEIVDEVSGIQFIKVKTDCETMMRALTGSGYMTVDFDLKPKYVGYIREHKTIWIETPDFSVTKEKAIELLKPHETDGWFAEPNDILNHHKFENRKGKTGYNVGYFRYVKPKKDVTP